MSTQGARMPEGDNRSMLDHALAYAARGWHIFPCQAGGKTPLTMRGCREATNDPEAIRRWWGRWPNANIGLACGQASGVSVVDVDVDEAKSENGHDTLDALAAINGQLPPTLTTITPRGGAHYIYQADPPPANKNDYRDFAAELAPQRRPLRFHR